MSLLRRRMMMGVKQSDFQLVEVENMDLYTSEVVDDGRDFGFTLEKPFVGLLSPTNAWGYMPIMTDAEFICMDIPDNSQSSEYANVDRNIYIPAIGKWGISLQWNYGALRAESANTLGYNDVYPRYNVYDSLGRRWIKMEIHGAEPISGSEHKRLFQANMTVYYCTEADLGKVFPQRRWDKHYQVYQQIKVLTGKDITDKQVGSEQWFDGLKAVRSRAAIVTDIQNDAPANYDGTLEGYLLEIPDDADQLLVEFSGYSAWVVLYSSLVSDPDHITRVNDFGWNENSATITNTSSIKYASVILMIPDGQTESPTVTAVSVKEW